MVVGRVWWIVAIVTALCISVFAGSNFAVAAQTVPYKINYQGVLTNAHGVAKADAQYNMTFRIYTAASGGTAVWTEVRETTNRVTLTDGQFAVQLGDVTTLDPSLFTTQPLYFEIELPTPASATCSTAACAVYTEGPMTPRQPFGASAYAMNSDTLDGYDISGFISTDRNNTFGGTNIFKNSTNSTNAFNVQTLGGVSLLKIDTTNSTVEVGTTGGGTPAFATTSTGRVGIGLASPTTTLQIAGNVLFQNQADSATAFLVKNFAATTLFAVDTSTSRVVIGPATADAAAVLLVLDTKNTTGDPTGTPGATYYNSVTNRARCYERTAWVNCTGRRMARLSSNESNENDTYSDLSDLSFPVVANQTYQFSAIIGYTAGRDDGGSRWSINGPNTSALAYTTKYPGESSNITINHSSSYDSPSSENEGSFTNDSNIAKIEGSITPSENGTVVVRYAASGSGGREITVFAGSTITWWQ